MAKLLIGQVVQMFRSKNDSVECRVKPMVLCDECFHGRPGKDAFGNDAIECHKKGPYNVETHPPEWYCADGEVKIP